MAKFYEDYIVGEKRTTLGRTVTESDISMMLGITRYLEPLMIDEEFAKKAHFGARIAPGRMILLFMGGMAGNTGIFGLEEVIGLVGLDNIKFKNPLMAGDTIHVVLEITEKKETSKPERGVIFHTETCINQRGEVLATLDSAHLIKRKSAG